MATEKLITKFLLINLPLAIYRTKNCRKIRFSYPVSLLFIYFVDDFRDSRFSVIPKTLTRFAMSV